MSVSRIIYICIMKIIKKKIRPIRVFYHTVEKPFILVNDKKIFIDKDNKDIVRDALKKNFYKTKKTIYTDIDLKVKNESIKNKFSDYIKNMLEKRKLVKGKVNKLRTARSERSHINKNIDNKKLSEKNEELEKEKVRIEKEKEEAEKKYALLLGNNEHLKDKIEDLRREYNRDMMLIKEGKLDRPEKEMLTDEMSKTTRAIEDNKKTLEFTTEQVKQVKEYINRLNEDQKEKTDLINRLKEEHERTIHDLESEKSSRLNEIAKLTDEKKSVEDDLEKSKISKKEADEMLHKLKKNIKNKREEIDKLVGYTGEFVDLNNVISNMEEMKKSKEKDIDKMKYSVYTESIAKAVDKNFKTNAEINSSPILNLLSDKHIPGAKIKYETIEERIRGYIQNKGENIIEDIEKNYLKALKSKDTEKIHNELKEKHQDLIRHRGELNEKINRRESIAESYKKDQEKKLRIKDEKKIKKPEEKKVEEKKVEEEVPQTLIEQPKQEVPQSQIEQQQIEQPNPAIEQPQIEQPIEQQPQEQGSNRDNIDLRGGLYNYEIDDILHNYPYYIGAFGSDEGDTIINRIKKRGIKDKNYCFVVNTAPIKRDSDDPHHWTCVYHDSKNKDIEYFDSQPLEDGPSNDVVFMIKKICEELRYPHMLKFKYNTNQTQKDKTNSCGLHCIIFLMKRINGLNFDQSTLLNDINKNEEECKDILKRYKKFGYI